MRPTKYNCSCCSFSGNTTSIWGACYYYVDGLRVPVETIVGLCYECNSITPIEKLPTLEAVKALREHPGEVNGFKFPVEHYYRDEKARLNLLESRNAPAKCLECGGVDFILLTHEAIEGGVLHRNCGGRITKETLNYSLNMPDIPAKYYDINGNRIG